MLNTITVLCAHQRFIIQPSGIYAIDIYISYLNYVWQNQTRVMVSTVGQPNKYNIARGWSHYTNFPHPSFCITRIILTH